MFNRNGITRLDKSPPTLDPTMDKQIWNPGGPYLLTHRSDCEGCFARQQGPQGTTLQFPCWRFLTNLEFLAAGKQLLLFFTYNQLLVCTLIICKSSVHWLKTFVLTTTFVQTFTKLSFIKGNASSCRGVCTIKISKMDFLSINTSKLQDHPYW